MAGDMGNPFLQAVTDFVGFQNAQDIQGILRLMHKESFAYRPTQQVFLKLFAAFQLQTTLLHTAFITNDGEYAFVRIRLKTEKITGPDFRNNITEFLVVFRIMNHVWKIWWQQPLTFQLL